MKPPNSDSIDDMRNETSFQMHNATKIKKAAKWVSWKDNAHSNDLPNNGSNVTTNGKKGCSHAFMLPSEMSTLQTSVTTDDE